MSVPTNKQTSVAFPDGQVIYLEDISSIQPVSGNVIIGIGTIINAYTFAAADQATAQAIVNTIMQAKNGLISGIADQIIVSNGSSLTWISVTPDSGAINTDYMANIVGTGFSEIGNVEFQLFNGGMPVIVNTSRVVNSDSSITLLISGFAVNPAGAYDLQFSVDGSVTYNTTGLTITFS